jgi:hypothetical protein
MSEKILGRDFYLCWAIIRPAEDVPGLWTAHCLDFDVVSQGESVKQAIEMVLDATSMVVMDDHLRKANPKERVAPAEFWDDLRRIQEEGQKIDDLDAFLARRAALKVNEAVILAVPFAISLSHVEPVVPVSKPTRLPSFATDQIAC